MGGGREKRKLQPSLSATSRRVRKEKRRSKSPMKKPLEKEEFPKKKEKKDLISTITRPRTKSCELLKPNNDISIEMKKEKSEEIFLRPDAKPKPKEKARKLKKRNSFRAAVDRVRGRRPKSLMKTNSEGNIHSRLSSEQDNINLPLVASMRLNSMPSSSSEGIVCTLDTNTGSSKVDISKPILMCMCDSYSFFYTLFCDIYFIFFMYRPNSFFN